MIPSPHPCRHHGERGTRKCDSPEFPADADPELPGQRIIIPAMVPARKTQEVSSHMRGGHSGKGSAVEGCREHSLIKQANSSAEPRQPAHHGGPLDRCHPSGSDGKLDRQGPQYHVDNIVQQKLTAFGTEVEWCSPARTPNPTKMKAAVSHACCLGKKAERKKSPASRQHPAGRRNLPAPDNQLRKEDALVCRARSRALCGILADFLSGPRDRSFG